jgi:ABC-type lipoprotein export system ATPase subunit
MMSKLQVRQFWAVREVEIEFDQILLLIGEQASGKSTLAKLIYFFRSLHQELLEMLFNVQDLALSSDDPAGEISREYWGRIRRKFYQFFGSTRHLPPFDIVYSYTSQTNSSIRLWLDDDKKLRIHSGFQRTLFSPHLCKLLSELNKNAARKNLEEEANFRRIWTDIENFVSQFFGVEKVSMDFKGHYFPAGRVAAVNYSDVFKLAFASLLGGELRLLKERNTDDEIVNLSPSVDLYLMSEFLEHTERIKARFKNTGFTDLPTNGFATAHVENHHLLQLVQERIRLILKGDYRHDQRGEKIFYAKDRYVDLNDASSGQQEVIRILQDLYLVFLEKESTFRVIEEPEAHLYPMTQKYLLELLAIVMNYTNSQIIITTHSPYILSVLNNLLYATRVTKLNPNAYAEVAQTIPMACWLKADSFHAYALKDGYCHSIVDRETGLIDQNFLDEISEVLGEEFDTLYTMRVRAH